MTSAQPEVGERPAAPLADGRNGAAPRRTGPPPRPQRPASGGFFRRFVGWTKWLYPGMRVKRWMLVVVLGILVMTFGVDLVFLMQLADLGETPPPVAGGFDGWEAEARVRERAEVRRYERLLGLAPDARTATMLRDFLAVERRHESVLGGKWTQA